MMMGRSRFNIDPEDSGSRVALIALLVAGVGLFFSPWIHDVSVSILRIRGDGGGEYALLPRSILIERLQSAEDALSATQYQSVLYEMNQRDLVALEKEMRMRHTESHMTARVIVTPPRSHYDTIVIGAGSEDGVLEQDIVTVGGIAIGAVTAVYPYSSVAQLYSSPGTTFDARIGTTDAVTTVYGVGGGALEAKVPSELGVTLGDTATDPRTGYVFGTVQSITTRDIDTETYVRIALPVSLTSISLVSLTHRRD